MFIIYAKTITLKLLEPLQIQKQLKLTLLLKCIEIVAKVAKEIF